MRETFGVQVYPELKFDQHVELIANKANRMLRLIRRSFTFLDGPTIKKLYSVLSGPQHSRETKGCQKVYNEEHKANSRTEVP